MYKIETKLELPIAHRLDNAFAGLCMGRVSREGQPLPDTVKPVVHGHNYIVTVTLFTEMLDRMDMIIDFKMFKDLLKSVFNKYDHSLILKQGDPMLEYYKGTPENARLFIWERNPTAEVMAYTWHKEICEALTELANYMDEQYHYEDLGTVWHIEVAVEETAHNKVAYYE